MKAFFTIALFGSLVACTAAERQFPLRDPMSRDTDLDSVSVRCRPSTDDPHHVTCAPEPYYSPLYWDGADNLFFRPLSEMLGVTTTHESVNVNSLDEVPDSAWFTNRIGARGLSDEEVRLGACTPADILDPEHAPDGSWVIDKGKTEGSSPGFRIRVGKRKYLLKVDEADDEPERESASAVIGLAVYHAAGYYTSCEQIINVRPSLFTLKPGLTSKANFEEAKPFDQRALDRIFAQATRDKSGRLRFVASAWIPGYSLGAFRYVGTREDDPNDVIDHENRRELRGARILAAWIDRFDARQGNSLDSWMADKKDGPPDASPGKIIHHQLDTSEALGSLWAQDEISRRLGYSYIVDWGDIATDFFSLGIPTRRWDVVKRHATFGYFDVEHFDAEGWKNEYPNPAFSRMTERDGAWMARILAHFTPSNVRTLADMGQFTDPANTAYLARTLQGRLDKIMQRYLTKLSPITDVRVAGDSLCGVDLAEMRALRLAESFRYDARVVGGGALAVTRQNGGAVCVSLVHGPARYVRIAITDGVAQGALVAHVYDLGADGFRLAGVERPSP